MAFSKAKILRFNDINSCAPPPGAYNPKYDAHVAGAIIFSKDSKDKVVEPRSPASSCSEIKSVHSCASVPSFRTPTIPRRKKTITLPNSAGKKISSAKLFSPHKSEALREKMVECANKDETIKDLESQLEDLKLAISNLRVDKENLLLEKEDTLQKLNEVRDKFENVNSQLQESLLQNKSISEDFIKMKAELKEQNTAQMKQLQDNLSLLEERLKLNLKETESVLNETEQKLANKETACSELECELFKVREELSILESRYEDSLKTQADLQNSHAKEIESLKRLHQTEVEDLEYEMLKIVTEWQRTVEVIETENRKKLKEMDLQKLEEMDRMKNNYEAQLSKLTEQTEAQIRQSEENCTEKIKLAEMQMEENRKELDHHWQMKLQEQEQKSEEIMKECQAIGEYSIIQCEVEKNEIKQELQEHKELLDKLKQENQQITLENSELQKSVANLKTDLSNIIIELNDARDKLGKEIDLRQKDLESALAEKHSYEITLCKTHDTVNALKNRLLNSDRDVEQLKDELEALEFSKLESESKCTLLNDELQQAYKINEELTAKNLALLQIEDKVRILQADMLGQIDDMKLKFRADKQRALEEFQVFFNNQQSLHCEAQVLVTEAKNEIDRLESEVTDYKFKVARLETSLETSKKDMAAQEKSLEEKDEQVTELKNKLKERETEINEIASIYKKYIERSKQFDDLQQSYEELVETIQKLEKTIADQNALIGPFREQLENYERECQLLLAHKDEAEKEAKEMGLKYAEILGHQNYKQKLKHMVDLKKKNIDLMESKHECEAKIMQQSRTIDKLKAEVAALSRASRRSKSVAPADKENLCSPVRARLDSPGNPLKERN